MAYYSSDVDCIFSIHCERDYGFWGRIDCDIPLWITSLAFISANLGAQEVLGMAANGAKYGLYTVHFYWLGAALAMIFLGVFTTFTFSYYVKVKEKNAEKKITELGRRIIKNN